MEDSLRIVLTHRAMGSRGVTFARLCADTVPLPPLLSTPEADRLVSRQLAIMAAMDAHWVPPWSWPRWFDGVRGAAVGLFVRGAYRLLDSPAVAFVGARRASPQAERWAWERAGEAVRAGYVVVSGGARGIDAAAHRGAL
ncbi:MAG: DNA-processing protein DprA, partial [Myxococcota bacterium]